jgi:hypothetical protein
VVGTGAFPTRTTLTFTPTSGSLTVTVSGTVQYGQLELGAFATSWISTAGATATRNADVAQITGTNFSRWYSQVAGTVFVNAREKIDTTTRLVANFCTPSSEVYSAATFNNTTRIRAQNTSSGAISTTTSGTYFKLAYSFDSASQAGSSNGSAVTSLAVSVTINASQLVIGANQINTGQFGSHIRRLAYFDRRLPNATLQVITA